MDTQTGQVGQSADVGSCIEPQDERGSSSQDGSPDDQLDPDNHADDTLELDMV